MQFSYYYEFCLDFICIFKEEFDILVIVLCMGKMEKLILNRL